MAISKVGVVGLGTMGAGIAEVCARHGYAVIGVEIDDEAQARGRETIEHSSARAVEGGKLSEDERSALLGRISYTLDIADLSDVDLVVEAVPESLDLKREVFRALVHTDDRICEPVFFQRDGQRPADESYSNNGNVHGIISFFENELSTPAPFAALRQK